MEQLQRLAFASVGRGCAFAALGIVCVMVGLSYDPVAAARAGGMLTLMLCAVLILKAQTAARRPYRRTELWLMLGERDRPPAAIAQQATSAVLREAYFQFAHHTALVSVALSATALLLSWAGLTFSGR